MSDDEILRPTIVLRLEVKGIAHYLDVDAGSFKTYHDSKGGERFKFTQDGITIAGPMSDIEREETLLRVTRSAFETSQDKTLPERNGYLTNFT